MSSGRESSPVSGPKEAQSLRGWWDPQGSAHGGRSRRPPRALSRRQRQSGGLSWRLCLPGSRNTCCRAPPPSPQSTRPAMPPAFARIRSAAPEGAAPTGLTTRCAGPSWSRAENGGRRVYSGWRSALRAWRGPGGGPRTNLVSFPKPTGCSC